MQPPNINPASFAAANFANSSIYNIMFATVIGVIIANSAQIIPQLVMQFIMYVKTYLENLYKSKFDSYNEVVLTSIVNNGTHGCTESYPIEYDAVMFKLNNKNINTRCVKNKCQDLDSIYGRQSDTSKKNEATTYNICCNEKIMISQKNDIFIVCTDTNPYTVATPDTSINSNKSSIKLYNIHVRSRLLSVPEIIQKIDDWRLQYIDHKKRYVNDGNIYYYYFDKTSQKSKSTDASSESIFSIPTSKSTSQSTSTISWHKYQMKSTKSFDNIFFEDKDRLLIRLNYFLNNRLEYERKGIPYTLGLLFYGEPGCGKTSCIKALANFTKRNVVEINLKNIHTCGEFVDVFRNEFINDSFIPIDKRIIVLEDIDCMLDVVKQRNTTDSDSSTSTDDNVDIDTVLKMAMIEKYKKDSGGAEQKLTLSCVLNTIDGILEQEGRIIIITTNYKDKLDSALLRPGRIDMKINFTRCSGIMVKNIIEHFYGQRITDDREFEDNVYTPAEIIEKCFNCTDIDNIFKF